MFRIFKMKWAKEQRAKKNILRKRKWLPPIHSVETPKNVKSTWKRRLADALGPNYRLVTGSYEIAIYIKPSEEYSNGDSTLAWETLGVINKNSKVIKSPRPELVQKLTELGFKAVLDD